MRVLIRDVPANVGSTVTVSGWIHRIRELGAVSFVLVRDRTGIVQVVYEGGVEFTLESVVTIFGDVVENPKAPGGFEVKATHTDVLAPAVADLPIAVNQDPDAVGIDAILDNRIVSLRNPKIRSIFTVQSTILRLFAEFLRSEQFTEIKTSKLIGTGTEGGTGLFSVQYFDDTVYLAQSPQFYKQTMVASGLERVFEIGAAYRAEKHDTPRHLNEYVSLDVEMAFIENENDLMDLECRLLQHIVAGVNTEHHDILESWGIEPVDPEAIERIPRISHDDAKEIVSTALGRRVFELNPESERVLSDWARTEHGIDAVFVHGFPRKKRPFYTYPDGLKTRSFDLIFRGLEITTGGQRIHEYAMLRDTLPKFGLTENGLADYMQIFRYGCPPHGGFAIGLERLTQKLLGLQNVKEASLFPRDRRRTRP
ncbi:MAG: aspartate--tRNA(Asn) ligase [Spirochaetaceae bacterium]|nr:MAG: aspartate--tRNA(Asn) ligase [Spirochaetaceae bacterium]